jgi:hypothetical protein
MRRWARHKATAVPDEALRSSRSTGKTIAWVLAVLVLIGTGMLGVRNGVAEWSGAGTGWQKSVTGGVLLYGVLGLGAGIGLLRRRAWSLPLAVAWGVVVTYVPGVAVLAYGGRDGTIGAALAASSGAALAASSGAALIALLVVLATRAAVRTPVRDAPRARSG